MVVEYEPIMIEPFSSQTNVFNLLQDTVIDLVSNVREGLRQRMDEVDWLDDDTRRLAIDKVKSSFMYAQI